MARGYDFKSIEEKWRKRWNDLQLFKAEKDVNKPKFYCLEMYPYPSGTLHMGHVRNYCIGDAISIFRKLCGYNVLHPMGWDSFGMPAENAAIKHNIHPATWTEENIKNMKEQLIQLGFTYDWSREISSCDPNYYKWCQWIFLKMWERDLAYRKKAKVNWCETCQTVLANEQVEDGTCWRCHKPVSTREMFSWFLRITAYAEELLADLETLKEWPERVLIMQKNWIGKSVGAEVDFPIAGTDRSLSIFTTRPDTLYGATFMVMALEHPLLDEIISDPGIKDEILKFRDKTIAQRRLQANFEEEQFEKEGLDTGIKALNPFTNELIPIYVSNFVLMEYGTGAIMSVPAHDQRDFEFAKKYDLPIRVVIQPPDGHLDEANMDKAYEGEGVMVNSGIFSGLYSADGIKKITEYMEEKGIGKYAVSYRLRDWNISRQRYWGTPIPIIYCDNCGMVPVPEKDLPVLLPLDVKISGFGGSPLANHPTFPNTHCPICNSPAKRECDTMDTFIDSSWYFLRFTSPDAKDLPFSPEDADYWMPVDHYTGGIEHAVLHLLYSRFFTKFLRDIGLIKCKEPFKKLLTQGMVLNEGVVMSKSLGNVISPTELINEYGVDTVRIFTLFAAPPEKDLDWSSKGVAGASRFVHRVFAMVQDRYPDLEKIDDGEINVVLLSSNAKNLWRMLNNTIKKVTEEMSFRYHFNTAIAFLMDLVNEIYLFAPEGKGDQLLMEKRILKKTIETIPILLTPFAPYLAEELNQMMGNKQSIFNKPWPKYDPSAIEQEMITYVVQIDGKVRSKLEVPAETSEEEIKQKALLDEKVQKWLEGKTVIKVIVVPGKLISIVAK